jgi:hypothetical protein
MLHPSHEVSKYPILVSLESIWKLKYSEYVRGNWYLFGFGWVGDRDAGLNLRVCVLVHLVGFDNKQVLPFGVSVRTDTRARRDFRWLRSKGGDS